MAFSLFAGLCILCSVIFLNVLFVNCNGCPEVPSVQFDLKKYSGNWYISTRSKGQEYSCSLAYYDVIKNSSGVFIDHNFRARLLNGSIENHTETSFVPDTMTDYAYRTDYPDGSYFNGYVLDFDHSENPQYYLEYGCYFHNSEYISYLWLNTRSLEVDQKTLDRMNQINEEYHLNFTIESQPAMCIGL